MTSLDVLPAGQDRGAASADARSRWTVVIARSVSEASHAWLSLEVAGCATGYQTLGWQRAAYEALHAGETPLIVLVRDAAGRTAGILPLVAARRRGVTIARFSGGKHANYNLGLYRQDLASGLDADALRALLSDAARQAGVDVFAFRNQPERWLGQPNPLLLLPHQRAAHSAWKADLPADGDAFIASIMSGESRKKLRHKERKIAEIGPVTYAEAVTADEARTTLAAFLAQKKARFAALGVPNPFDDPAALRFLELAAAKPLEEGPPAPVSLFAMMAGERIAAVFGGVIHGGRFSGMFTSFDPAPEIARFSPGDLLLMNLVRMMCARGLTAFDLGVGDAAYKTDYCATEERLFDSVIPVTLKGRAVAAAMAAGLAAKRAAKRTPWLAAAARKLARR